MNEIKSKHYSEEQLKEINLGFKDNLSLDKVIFYANPKFNAEQMREIRLGLSAGLSKDEVLIYAYPNLTKYPALIQAKRDFNAEEMKEIREGLYYMSIEDVLLYADPLYDVYQMREIKQGIEQEFSKEQMAMYLSSIFTSEQMKVIRFGLEQGLSNDKISIFARCEFDASQMQVLRSRLKNGISPQVVGRYAKPEFNASQMLIIYNGYEYGLSIDLVDIYAKPEYDEDQMDEICTGLFRLEKSQVLTYANPELSASRMRVIRLGYENNLEQHDVDTINSLDLDSKQVDVVYEGINSNLSLDQVMLYASGKEEHKKMHDTLINFKDNLVNEDVKKLYLYLFEDSDVITYDRFCIIDKSSLNVIRKLLSYGIKKEHLVAIITSSINDNIPLIEVLLGYGDKETLESDVKLERIKPINNK